MRPPGDAVTGEGREARVGRPARAGRMSRWQAAFVVLLAAGIVTGVLWALLGSQLLVVRGVEVTGARRIPTAEVVEVAAVPPRLPLIRIDTRLVESRVERIRQVESATVTRRWPDRIAITVRERTPALAVARGVDGFDLIDRFGVVVTTVSTRPRRYPLFTAAGPTEGDPAVRAAVEVVGLLPDRLTRRLRAIEAAEPDEVTLRLRDGVTVVWGGPERSAAKAAVLAALMAKPAVKGSTFYDVSDPEVAVTR